MLAEESGVLVIEALAQAGAILILRELEDRANKIPFFSTIEHAKFRRPVVPGDQLILESLPFESTLNQEEPASPPPSPRSPLTVWVEKLGGPQKVLYLAAMAAGLVLLLVSAAIWLTRRKLRRAFKVGLPAELPPGETQEGAAPLGQQGERPVVDTAPDYPELPPAPIEKANVLAERLRLAIRKEPEATAQVFRTWLSEDEHA